MQPPDKNQKAIALKYEMGKDEAPKVIAKGKGEVAAQIIKIAKENGIEIKEDKNLTEILSALEIDEFIPLEAYTAVAEILRYIYQKKAKT
jgi:flagellar biosynthesis protein